MTEDAIASGKVLDSQKGQATPADVLSLIVTSGVSALVGKVSDSGLAAAVLLAVMLVSIIVWRRYGHILRSRGRIVVLVLWPLLLPVSLLMLPGPRAFVFGEPRLRGIVIGLNRPPVSDFSWSTNGSVTADRYEASDDGEFPELKATFVLYSDQENADAGWGVNLLAWQWFSPFGLDYNPWYRKKTQLVLDLRGDSGDERVGLSLKWDHDSPSASRATSREKRVALGDLGVSLTKDWREVRLPLDRFSGVNLGRLRNVALYVDLRSAMPVVAQGAARPSEIVHTVFVRRVRFE